MWLMCLFSGHWTKCQCGTLLISNVLIGGRGKHIPGHQILGYPQSESWVASIVRLRCITKALY